MERIYYIDGSEVQAFLSGDVITAPGVAYEWEGEGVVHLHLKPLKHAYGLCRTVLFTREAHPAADADTDYTVCVAEDGSCTVWTDGASNQARTIPTKENLYSRNHGILELGILENKRVVIIGLGSFGSQIAIELAKAGVGSFALMDFDRIELHNLARHTATTRDLGRLKTDVLREAIEGKNPYAHVDLFPIDINQHLETLLDECRKADLVICATDNNLSRINISQALINTQTPGIFGSALTRAEGGCVFHYQPGGPCYNCFLGNGLIAGAREEVSSVEAGRRSGQIAAYTSPEDADAVVQVGLSADIEPICNMVVKLALVELSRGTESGISSLEKELVFPAYLWVNRRERHFLRFASFADPGNRPTIMRWYGIRMQKDENCVLCGKAHDFVVEQKLLDDMGVTLDDLQAQTADLDQTLAEL